MHKGTSNDSLACNFEYTPPPLLRYRSHYRLTSTTAVRRRRRVSAGSEARVCGGCLCVSGRGSVCASCVGFMRAVCTSTLVGPTTTSRAAASSDRPVRRPGRYTVYVCVHTAMPHSFALCTTCVRCEALLERNSHSHDTTKRGTRTATTLHLEL